MLFLHKVNSKMKAKHLYKLDNGRNTCDPACNNINMIYKHNQSLNIISIMASLLGIQQRTKPRGAKGRGGRTGREECEVRGTCSTMFRPRQRVIDLK